MKEKSTVESNCKNICLIYADNITELLLKCHGVNFNVGHLLNVFVLADLSYVIHSILTES